MKKNRYAVASEKYIGEYKGLGLISMTVGHKNAKKWRQSGVKILHQP